MTSPLPTAPASAHSPSLRGGGRRLRRVCGAAGGLALNLAAIGGLVCIVLVALALVFDVTLILFKTGSMSPGIPAGSLAVVREIPASEIAVGDVVTVDRPGALPLTHRVSTVSPGPTDAERIITMKGDANAAPDPHPYVVGSVRLVLGSVPGLAAMVAGFSHPVVLGSITVGASALVGWAFWPRGPGGSAPAVGGRRPGRHSAAPAGARPARPARRGRDRAPSRRAHRATAALVLVSLAGGTLLATAHPAPAAASASEPSPSPHTERLIAGGSLRLLSIGDSAAMMRLGDDTTAAWEVGVWAVPPASGVISLSLAATGSAALELEASVRSCTVRWQRGSCASGAATVLPRMRLELDGVDRELETMPTGEERWLRLEVGRAPGAAPVVNEEVQLRVHATGAGADLSVGQDGSSGLPVVGASPLAPFLAAGGAIAAGLLIAAAAAARQRQQ